MPPGQQFTSPDDCEGEQAAPPIEADVRRRISVGVPGGHHDLKIVESAARRRRYQGVRHRRVARCLCIRRHHQVDRLVERIGRVAEGITQEEGALPGGIGRGAATHIEEACPNRARLYAVFR